VVVVVVVVVVDFLSDYLSTHSMRLEPQF